MSGLSRLHACKRLVVCVGPGGVGKTTLAAALAIDAASSGRRVALVTIDPARRLAGALGLLRLDDSLSPVPGVPGLEAAMLDTKASFDALVGRVAGSEAARARILDNRIYEAFSRTLSRPHAYIAMERLHDVVTRGGHDLVVLDTPPTRSALDILDAPGHLVRFLDSSVADAILGAHTGTSPASSEAHGARAWLRRQGAAFAGSLLSRVLGESLVADLAGFFEVFFHLRHGFAERAGEVQAILRAPSTAFVLVTAPDASHLGDAAALAEGLAERGVVLDGLLSNRVYHHGDTAPPEGPAYDPELLGSDPSERAILHAAKQFRRRLEAEDHDRRAAAAAFAGEHPARLHLGFPWQSEAPTDVAALRALTAACVEFAREPVPS